MGILLIIKNIYKKIHIDSFFYLYMIISCLSANFKNFILFLSIIIIHELGHIFMGIIFKWKIDGIYLYPYGGVTRFNEDINRCLYEELFILLGGSFFQIIYLFLGYYFFNNYYFIYYNLSILLFNLLPIYPLDGGRILNVFFSYFLSFRFSYYFIIIFSFFICILFIIFSFIFNYKYNFILMFLIVIFKIREEYKKRHYYFNKFILERYINDYGFKRIKIISSIKKMMRDCRHIIFINNKYYTEKDYLKNLYR